MLSRETARRVPLLRVLAAMFVYRLGKSMAGLTMPWLVLSLSHSPMWAGASAAGISIATIIGTMSGGSLADKAGPKPVLWGAGAAGGMVMAALAVLFVMDAATTETVVALFVLGSLLDAPAMVAQDSRLPELARLARLPLARATAFKSMLGHFAMFAGPALAGVAIVQMGMANALWMMACCSLLAAWLAAPALPAGPSRRRPPPAAGLDTMSAGVRLLWKDELLRPLVILTTVFVGVMTPAVTVIAPALFHHAGRDAADYGAFLSGSGAGAVLGTMIYAAIGPRLPSRWLFALGFAVYAGVFPLLTVLPSTIVLAAIGVCAGMASGPVAPLFNKILYQRSPLPLRGRVIGAYSGIVMAAVPAAVVLAGAGTQLFGAHAALHVAAAIAAGVGLMSLRLKLQS